jgi:hypothetical protein
MLVLISGVILHAFFALFAWLGSNGDVGFLSVSFSKDAWRILSFPIFTLMPGYVTTANFWQMFGLNSLMWGVAGYALFGLLKPLR